jgi:hypothetical protein
LKSIAVNLRDKKIVLFVRKIYNFCLAKKQKE